MNKLIYVDATDARLGRMGSFVVKELLKGKSVNIINSEKVIISGNKKVVVEKYRTLRQKGSSSQKGPKVSKDIEKLLKRILRGMLPWDKPRGREVYKNLKCYKGNPFGDEAKDLKTFKQEKPIKYLTLQKVVELI
jgi:large subunit ribosomal protein L13